MSELEYDKMVDALEATNAELKRRADKLAEALREQRALLNDFMDCSDYAAEVIPNRQTEIDAALREWEQTK